LDLDKPEEREQFLSAREDMRRIPGSDDTVPYCSTPMLGIGRSRLGTSQAVALGAYAVATDDGET
jgi:glucokinase